MQEGYIHNMPHICTLPVTIVTANYNNGRYLSNYFESILNSSALPECIIFVDDGSTDESMSILDSYKSRMTNLVVIRFPQNRGFANALNSGMELVTTNFVIRLDPDDWIEPTRIETQLTFLENNSNIGVVGSNITYVNDSDGSVAGTSNFKLDHDWIMSKYINGEYGIMHGAICARSALFRKYKYKQDYVPAEDYAIFALMISDGVQFANIQSTLSYIRIHRKSISNSLKYETIEKIFHLRSDIFNIKYSAIDVRFAYISRRNYRIALSCKMSFEKIYHLIVAGIFNPGAVLRRLGLR
jgi:glycosyltransferase involved in cell wall biosynthesis